MKDGERIKNRELTVEKDGGQESRPSVLCCACLTGTLSISFLFFLMHKHMFLPVPCPTESSFSQHPCIQRSAVQQYLLKALRNTSFHYCFLKSSPRSRANPYNLAELSMCFFFSFFFKLTHNQTRSRTKLTSPEKTTNIFSENMLIKHTDVTVKGDFVLFFLFFVFVCVNTDQGDCNIFRL